MKASGDLFRDHDLVFSVILRGTGTNVWLSSVKIKEYASVSQARQPREQDVTWPESSMMEVGVYGLYWD